MLSHFENFINKMYHKQFFILENGHRLDTLLLYNFHIFHVQVLGQKYKAAAEESQCLD